MPGWERKKVLITVRTYPSPAQKTIEASCTAGITEDGQWIRLFPIPWRLLADRQKFRKYQWIELSVRKATSDVRPESYTADCDSITILSDVPPANGWQARKDLIYPLRKHCMCCIAQERDIAKWPTLGIFKPREIQRLRIVPEKVPTWTQDELAKLNQSLFRVVDGKVIPDGSTRAPLEKIPMNFVYEFRCDHEDCKGHKMSSTDWEICQSYRDWRDQYGKDGWESKFRQRWEQDMLTRFDTHFYVGTMHGHPATWLIVGAFYPPVQPPSASAGPPSRPQQLKLLTD